MTLWRIRATVDDRPGFLAVLTASLALRSVNILSVQVHATEAGAIDDFLVDAPDTVSEEDLLAAVGRGRGRDPWVSRTEAHRLVDPPTEALAAAARVARDPDDLADALAGLLRATVAHAAHPAGSRPGLANGVIHIPDPGGGVLRVTREAPPFTPAEYARAHALGDLATQVSRVSGVRWRVALPSGDEIEVRPAGAADAGGIAAMHGRCSRAVLRCRFLGGRPVARIAAPPAATLVALAGSGLIVAAGTVGFDGPEAELGLLVEDAAQRRGVGTTLARRLVEIAADAGAAVVHIHAYRDNKALARTVERLGLPMIRTYDGPMVTLSADLRSASDEGSVVRLAGEHA
jgi:GNAT superfamily N-acetyltransferase